MVLKVPHWLVRVNVRLQPRRLAQKLKPKKAPEGWRDRNHVLVTFCHSSKRLFTMVVVHCLKHQRDGWPLALRSVMRQVLLPVHVMCMMIL
jgi:hypothetical protein